MATQGDSDPVPATSDTLTKPLFRAIDASNVEELETSELESLCLACGKMGVTRLLLTKIPLFRDILVMSFLCSHCGHMNNEVQESMPIQDEGIRYTVSISQPQDLNRLAVKADSASLSIPSLEFEIPPNTQKGSVNTLEGFLLLSIEELEQDQPTRRTLHPEVATKLDDFIKKLQACLNVQTPFAVVIDDPSGNSFVENKLTPQTDPALIVEKYKRSEDQDKQLGVLISTTKGEATNDEDIGCDEGNNPVSHDEVLNFQINCPNCQMSTETKMKIVDIPHFKEVVVMSLSCEWCGHKSNEIKSGSGINDRGVKITLHLTDSTDLSRDILKAETASLVIPELDFELQPGTLGGRFTTIEGLLRNIKDQLADSNPFVTGDSSTGNKLTLFVDKLVEIMEGRRLNVHIVLNDPAGNSYLQNVYAPEEDPEMKVEHYQRTYEQNELLGLDALKTEDY